MHPVVSIGETFVYKVNDVPVILVHLVNAMRGEDDGFAEVDGIFQVSDNPIVTLFEGGMLGNMKLTSLSDDGIEFRERYVSDSDKEQPGPFSDWICIKSY